MNNFKYDLGVGVEVLSEVNADIQIGQVIFSSNLRERECVVDSSMITSTAMVVFKGF